MANEKINGGIFLGRARIARRSSNGGARHVFAQIKGLKNDQVFAPWGGVLQNPFKGAAKIYASDMFYIEYNDLCEDPKLYVLKTFEAFSSSGETLNLVRDGYHHVPFVGDKIMVAPEEIGGAGTSATVLEKSLDVIDGQKVWTLTLDKAITANKGDILVEADADDNMLIKDINGFAGCDYDFVYEEVADPEDIEDYDNADYALTPIAGILAYQHRMSVMPECIKKLNQCKWNGIFGFNALP